VLRTFWVKAQIFGKGLQTFLGIPVSHPQLIRVGVVGVRVGVVRVRVVRVTVVRVTVVRVRVVKVRDRGRIGVFRGRDKGLGLGHF
jgi:hypothetical protein